MGPVFKEDLKRLLVISNGVLINAVHKALYCNLYLWVNNALIPAFLFNMLHIFIAVKMGQKWPLPLLLPRVKGSQNCNKRMEGTSWHQTFFPIWYLLSFSRLVVFNLALLGGLSVQPAAMENKNVKIEEIGKRKLPGRHGMPIIISHKPINLVTPALSLDRAFFHLSHQHLKYLFHITTYFIAEIGVTLEPWEPFFSLLAWSVMRMAGAELQEAKTLVLVLEGSFPLLSLDRICGQGRQLCMPQWAAKGCFLFWESIPKIPVGVRKENG